MTLSMFDAKAKYTADKRPSGPICGCAVMSTVAAAAMLTFSGCSVAASRVHTTAATMTAAGPSGHAVANQKVEVIPTASAERIPIRAAGTGSDQSLQAMFGSGSS